MARCGCSARLAATTWEPRRDPGEHDAQHVVARRRTDLVQVVEHEHERRACRLRIAEASSGAARPSAETPCPPTSAARRSMPGAIQRVRGRQQGRAAPPDRRRTGRATPTRRVGLRVRPLGHQRRLAVPGGRRDAHDATPARPRGPEDVGATDGASGWGLRDRELRVEQEAIQLDLRRDRRRSIFEHARSLLIDGVRR